MRSLSAALVLCFGLALVLGSHDAATAGGGKKGAAKGKQHMQRVHKALHELHEAHKALIAAVLAEQKEAGGQAVAQELLRAANEVGDAISRAHAAAGLDRAKKK